MRTIIAVGALLVVAACTKTPVPDQIEVSYTPVKKPALVLPNVDKLSTRNVEWIIVTEENFEEVVAELKRRGQSVSFFAVTADGYEAVAVNLANIQKLVKQQKSIIAAYERYYKDVNKAIDDSNAANQ